MQTAPRALGWRWWRGWLRIIVTSHDLRPFTAEGHQLDEAAAALAPQPATASVKRRTASEALIEAAFFALLHLVNFQHRLCIAIRCINNVGAIRGVRSQRIRSCMSRISSFDDSDYSVVVKNRAPLPNAWRWEIYRAGRASHMGCSPVFFCTVSAAHRAGKAALKQLMAKTFAKRIPGLRMDVLKTT
jgi:hypothetical protein